MTGDAETPLSEISAPLSRAALDELQVGLVEVDHRLRILAHSPASGGFPCHGHDQVAGRALTELFPELLGVEEELQAIARGQSARFHLPMINRVSVNENTHNYLSLTALPHPAGPGRLILLVQDVTALGRLGQQVMQQLNEVRLLRAQLEAANQELVRLSEDKSAFLRMAAHDLRAPLAIVRGYVELVLEEAAVTLTEEWAGFLSIILARTAQMSDLIDRLLDIERIESGTVLLKREALDLRGLVEEVGQGFLPVARQKGQSLRWETQAGYPATAVLPRPWADRAYLVQVLHNLVSNALKFTPPGGTITIRVVPLAEEIAVEVVDTGPGISEEDQARLFRRFFRTDTVRQRRVPGAGLGLAIVRAIVEQQGGRVYCRSQIGQGSTFGFALPLEEG
jgi:signal transduction histidine kinase